NVEFAEASLPLLNGTLEFRIERTQSLGVLALFARKCAQHILGRERFLVLIVHGHLKPPPRLGTHAAADFKQTASQPSLDCVHRNIELFCQLIATPTAVVREQYDALLFRIELAEARKKAL